MKYLKCLQKKFDIGQKTGRKEDPAQVANDMRSARKTDGTQIFSRMEWLSKLHIQEFSSRLSAKREQSDGKQIFSDDEPDDDEELAEEYASLTDEQMLEKASVAVQSEIGVKHPVMYNVYNFCEMAFENRLSFFKVKMLREMCKHFEIPSNLRDTKSSLVKKLSQMVECSCMKESNYAMNVSNNYFGKLKFHNFVHGDIRDGSGLFGLWIMRSRPNGRNCRMK